MKPDETAFRSKKRYVAMMILCFLYGGFSLILFLSQVYSAFWITDIVGLPSGTDSNHFSIDSNHFDDLNNLTAAGQRRFENPLRTPRNPFELISSPASLIYLLGGIVSILAGFAIWNLIREKEIKHVKRETANNLLLPDERTVIDSLKASDYESTQARLVKETGLSKVQIHRTIKRLEAKGVLEKHEYGLTNKILLKKELFE